MNDGSQSELNLDKLLQSLGFLFIPQLGHRSRGKLATTGVSQWCAVDSARAAGECVTQLPLQLKTDTKYRTLCTWTLYWLDPEGGRAVGIFTGGF